VRPQKVPTQGWLIGASLQSSRLTQSSAESSTRVAGVSFYTDADFCVAQDYFGMEWKPVASAPFDRNLELAVIDYDGCHALVFPCCRILDGWINAETRMQIDVRPTHWREWRGVD